MSSLTIKERKGKFSELSNSLNTKQIKGYKKDIQYVVGYINKGKNFKIKRTDSSNKSKCMAYCSELPYGILSYSSYIDLGRIKVVSSAVKKINTNF